MNIFNSAPKGFYPLPNLSIFSTVKDPTQSVMAQLHRNEDFGWKNDVWVVVPVERVEKIKMISPEQFTPKP